MIEGKYIVLSVMWLAVAITALKDGWAALIMAFFAAMTTSGILD